MTIDFGSHEDVFFAKAPLILVLTQVKFSPILSLMSQAGLTGFQEAIRDEYPFLTSEKEADIEVGTQGMAVRERAPVWRLADEDGEDWVWRVSAAIDFISLETKTYTTFAKYRDRLAFVLDAARRTLQPSDSVRVGMRKINDFKHPQVENGGDWVNWLQPEVLGMLAAKSQGPQPVFDFADTRYTDDGMSWLIVRHGLLDPEESAYRVDLDYFTDQPFEISADSGLLDTLQTFSDAMTGFFHWILKPEMYSYLDPRPRSTS